MARKKFEVREGHEIRGLMIKLYPTQEQDVALRSIEGQVRSVWNWLVKQVEDVLAARAAYAVREGLVPPRPERPDYDGMSPDASKEARSDHHRACGEWHGKVHAVTKDVPACSFRKFNEELAHHGVKHDYQLFKRALSWWAERDGERAADPGAHVLQAVAKNYFQKSDRRKKFRKRQDAMPIQVRSGSCFEHGDFGTRGGAPSMNEEAIRHRAARELERAAKIESMTPEDLERHEKASAASAAGRDREAPFYNCRISINGLKIRGRLPGRAPWGRVLEGVSVTRKADGWWASIKQEIPKRVLPEVEPGRVVGIDVGLVLIAATSDGLKIPNPRGAEYAERIAGRQALGKPTERLQLSAARRVKHELYSRLVPVMASAEEIKVERLQSKIGQMGSSKVSAMRMVKEILVDRYGEERVREVDCRYTSQDCSQCGHRSKESWSYEHGRVGECPACGYREDRDVNAARNIASRPPISLAV